MDSPDAAPRSSLRRALPWIGGVAVVALLAGGMFLPGPTPDSGSRTCQESAIGPVGAALTGPPGPWPADWAALMAQPSSAPLGMQGTRVLRCPEDPNTADPLAAPSFVLVTGIDRDMPPQLVACYERECFHVVQGRGNVRYAQQWFVTLGGELTYFATPISGTLSEATAKQRMGQAMGRLVARDATGLAVMALREAVSTGDAGALRQVRESLHADDHRLRLYAAWTAGAAHHAGLVAPLVAALAREPELLVREEIARSLAMLGDRRGLPVLLKALRGPPAVNRGGAPGEPPEPRVRRARAHEALVRLAGADHGGLFDPNAADLWQRWAQQ